MRMRIAIDNHTRCPYCHGTGEGEVGKRCQDCDGMSVVCCLCREKSGVCECSGGRPEKVKPGCKRPLF